jgi:hypothetical protein
MRKPAVGPSLRVLAVSPLHWSAGYDYLLVGLRRLLDRGRAVTLRVEADGPARERFLFTAGDLGLAAVVTLTAPPRDLVTPRFDLPPAFDVLALAAIVDGPRPEVLAARARASALVATDLPWARRHLGGGAAPAELVPARSAGALAAALAVFAPTPAVADATPTRGEP